MTLVSQTNAQTAKDLCNLGITFEISNNRSWGYGEPVILSVEPYSPADKAGLKVDDIIMEVNGEATYLRNFPTVNNWLTDNSTSEIKLTIRNTDTYFKEYSVVRDCSPANALSEYDLSSAYSFYSIENNNERGFSIPLVVDPNKSINYSDYNTFSFATDNKKSTALDVYVIAEVQKALESRGLVRNDNDPDMVVQTYYSYQPNLKYDYSKTGKSLKTWRFDPESQKMVQLPIISAEDPNAEAKGEFILELGIRFFDKKLIDKDNLTQIWDCRSREFLSEGFSIEEYTRIHAPLMMMQYPYSNAKSGAKYIVNFKKFNYTGLNYDPTQTGLILSVDKGSPAYLSGVRAGDQITKINNTKFNYTEQELNNGYKRFIIATMDFRDPSTKFINASGFPDCMYWSKANFEEIRKSFSKSFYATSFSYLFAFDKFISNTNALNVDYKSGSSNKKIRINPEVQSSVVVTAL